MCNTVRLMEKQLYLGSHNCKKISTLTVANVTLLLLSVDLKWFVACLQVRKANFNRDSYLQQFGIAVNTQMTDVQGRVLTPPKILYGGWVCSDSNAYSRLSLNKPLAKSFSIESLPAFMSVDEIIQIFVMILFIVSCIKENSIRISPVFCVHMRQYNPYTDKGTSSTQSGSVGYEREAVLLWYRDKSMGYSLLRSTESGQRRRTQVLNILLYLCVLMC